MGSDVTGRRDDVSGVSSRLHLAFISTILIFPLMISRRPFTQTLYIYERTILVDVLQNSSVEVLKAVIQHCSSSNMWFSVMNIYFNWNYPNPHKKN